MTRVIVLLLATFVATQSANAMRSVSIPQDDRVFSVGESEAFEATPYTHILKRAWTAAAPFTATKCR